MEYEFFKEKLMNRLLTEAEEGTRVEILKIPQNNGIMNEGIGIRKGASEIVAAASLKNCYRSWQKGSVTLEEIAETILHETYDRETPQCIRKIPESIPDNQLRIKLVNYEMNKEYLRDLPFRRKMDLAEICCIILEASESGTGICDVTHTLLTGWGIDEEELFRRAEAGSRLWDPPEYMPITDVIADMSETGDVSLTYMDDSPFYVAMVKNQVNGAVCLLYEDFLSGIAEEADAGLFLIPSSIHEILVLPDRGEYKKEELEKMVREVNRNHVLPEEVLSDHIYYFDRERNRVRPA